MNSAKGRSRKGNFSLLILIIFIVGCSSKAETENPQKATNSPTPVSSPTAVLYTSTPSATPQATPIIEVIDKCISVEDTLPSDLQLTGTWVRQEPDPYLEIIEENTKYRVPLDGHGRLYDSEGSWSVSPNGEWLAYIDTVYDTTGRFWRTNGGLLKVIHSSGYSLSMDYWPMSNQKIRGWVDDENLILELGQHSLVLNPFSGKWYELKDPDWLSSLIVNKPWWYEIKKYNPHLDSVIVRLDNHSEIKEAVSGNTLFGDTALGFFGESVWSSDAVMLAFATNDGNVIHIFQNNKEILTLDFLNDKSLNSNFREGISISELKWSLNDQRLLIGTYDDNILLLDINEQILYKLCFENKEINNYAWDNFFYLKSGQHIVAPVNLRSQDYHYEQFDVLIDTTTMRAYRLPTSDLNGRIGWLALPESAEK